MITSIYSKSRKLFPVAFVAFAIALLASCSSSNQMASSFSKRRYTNGHFSDPVAKIKTDVKRSSTTTVSLPATGIDNGIANNTQVTKNESAVVKPNFTASVQSTQSQNNKVVFTSLKSVKKTVFAFAQSPFTTTNGNVAVNESVNSQGSLAYGDHGDHDGGRHGGGHHYLLDCLLCLLLWLIFIILAAASAVGGSGAGLGLFGILAWISAIAAVVFFILWLIDLAR